MNFYLAVTMEDLAVGIQVLGEREGKAIWIVSFLHPPG